MENEEIDLVPVRSIEETTHVIKTDYAKILIERNINNLDVSFSAKMNNLEDFFITDSKILSMENLLTRFEDNLKSILSTFKDSNYLYDNNYMLLENSKLKQKDLITLPRLSSILDDYIKPEELETSIEECTEFSNNAAAQIAAALANPAALAKAALFKSAAEDGYHEDMSRWLSVMNASILSIRTALTSEN